MLSISMIKKKKPDRKISSLLNTFNYSSSAMTEIYQSRCKLQELFNCLRCCGFQWCFHKIITFCCLLLQIMKTVTIPNDLPSSSHPSSPLHQWGKNARWGALHRKKWQLVDTLHSPPWLEQDLPHQSSSCEWKKKSFYKVTSLELIRFRSHTEQELDDLIQDLRWGSFKLGILLHTHHFIRNISSPLESVAPMILSGSNPRAKPLSFSG